MFYQATHFLAKCGLFDWADNRYSNQKRGFSWIKGE